MELARANESSSSGHMNCPLATGESRVGKDRDIGRTDNR